MRERTGEKRRNADQQWVGRVRDGGGKRSPWISLNTKDESVAEENLARWVETTIPPSQAGRELFRHASERLLERMKQNGKQKKAIVDRKGRLEKFVWPVIGGIAVGRIKTADVAAVLDGMAKTHGMARGTINCALSDVSRTLAMVRREGAVEHNVALDVGLPEDSTEDGRLPIVLSDEEILRFRRRGFSTELDMMVLFCCEIGGHRTSDLHAASWQDCDLPGFETMHVRRPKTTDGSGRDLDERRERERPGRKRRSGRAFDKVRHVIDPLTRQHLGLWWQGQGRPKAGPIFPVRKGKRLGAYKRNMNYAKAFRDALWAEGIVRPLPGYEMATGQDRRKFCALQVDTDETLKVDFHSLRRWFATKMANSGVNLQTAMDLCGHSVVSTHQRYLAGRVIEIPAAAKLGQPPPVGAPAASAPPPPPAAPVPSQPGIDPAALAALVAGAVAQALVGHAGVAAHREYLAPTPEPLPPTAEPKTAIDPRFGSQRPRSALRAIKGGK